MAEQVQQFDYLEARIGAQRTSTLIQVGALLGAVVCVVVAALLQAPINEQREDLNLVLNSDIYEGLPPKYAWVSAAGGAFRGLAVNILWVRADRLKEEGKYYEAHQLAKWMCTLQPRFPAVWQFHGWNMAYNISVATHTPEERWQWVYNGIRLLRDEGIPNNDRTLSLYRELAWYWFHKVGGRSDDKHLFYKRQWAAMMYTLLGEPPPGASAEEEIDWFRPVAEAPDTLDELIAARPGVAMLVERLASLGVDADAGSDLSNVFHPLEENFFRYYTSYLTRQQVEKLASSPFIVSEQIRPMFDFFEEVERDPGAAEDFQALLAYLRAKVLREQYKMKAAFMLEMTGMLGTDDPLPIDWRTPASQTMYWTLWGREVTDEVEVTKEFDSLNTDRLMLFALQEQALRGRMIFMLNAVSPMDSYLATLPDTRYIEAMHRQYIAMGVEHKEEGEDVENRTSEMLRSGHVNYLEGAIVNLYLVGREAEARKYLEYLAVHYKHTVTGDTEERYLQGLEQFVRSQLSDRASRQTVTPLIQSMLTKSYMRAANAQTEAYAAGVEKAAEVYKFYQSEQIDTPDGRMALRPFKQMQAEALAYFLTGFSTGESVPIIYLARVWRVVPEEIRSIAAELQGVPEYLNMLCDRNAVDVKKVFPGVPEVSAPLDDTTELKREEDVAEEFKEREIERERQATE